MKVLKIIILLIPISFLLCNKKEVKTANIYNENKLELAIVDFSDTIIKNPNTHDADISRYVMLIYYSPINES